MEEETRKTIKEQFDKLLEYQKQYVQDLKKMPFGAVKEIVINDYQSHHIKRIDEHTWEYVCTCCNGRRLAIGGQGGVFDSGTHEKPCAVCGKMFCYCLGDKNGK